MTGLNVADFFLQTDKPYGSVLLWFLPCIFLRNEVSNVDIIQCIVRHQPTDGSNGMQCVQHHTTTKQSADGSKRKDSIRCPWGHCRRSQGPKIASIIRNSWYLLLVQKAHWWISSAQMQCSMNWWIYTASVLVSWLIWVIIDFIYSSYVTWKK